MLSIAILWHMHQPYYVNPLTKMAMMPWVRLHAAKGYLDMAEMARRHPEMRMVFNLTPVLIKQIDELVTGEVKDQWEEWTRISASELSPLDQCHLLEHFFKANWDNLIRPNPRYHQLLAKRGYDLNRTSLNAIASSFSKQDYLDLQVWFNLAWCGYAAHAEFQEIRELKSKGRNFSEEDKAILLSVHHRILESLIPRYRALMEAGCAELSTTPFFHPISPLILDSEFAHRSMPIALLPPRFHWPEDLENQLQLAIGQHASKFGSKPAGLWPSEGAVCPELIPICKNLGIEWFATDEDILFRSLAREFIHQAERTQLYHPYEAEWKGACVKTIFRDRSLSDFVGFSAAKNTAKDAASFIIHHIRGIASATESQKDPLVAVVLDGENAWEHFQDGGEGFLDSWYHMLSHPDGWQMTTLTDYVRRPVSRQHLNQLHSGSWIQGDFDIWIGDPEENRAWQILGETRQWWEQQHKQVSPEIAKQVWMEIYAAEGSDWFWWYGPDFTTDNDLVFDELFRTHLQNVYVLCGAKPPRSLFSPICHPSAHLQATVQNPIGVIQPILDGIQTNFFEWHEAGRYQAAQTRGTMFQKREVVRVIYYGFDLEKFYLRLDPSPEATQHTHLHIDIHFESHNPLEYEWLPVTGSLKPVNELTERISKCAYRKIIEISAGFADLTFKESETVRFHVSIRCKDANGSLTEIECHPHTGWLEFKVPDKMFPAKHWSA